MENNKDRPYEIAAIVIMLSAIAIFFIYQRYKFSKIYSNPKFAVGHVYGTENGVGGYFLNYRYSIGKTTHLSGGKTGVHENNTMEGKAMYEGAVGHKYVVRYNKDDPDYATIYLSCPLSDTIVQPDSGWNVSPVDCEALSEVRTWW